MKIYRYSPAGSLVSWAVMPEALAQAALASEPRCTAAEPPQTLPGMAPRWNGEGWELAPDHRGQVYHDPARQESMLITEVGVLPPPGWIFGPPAAPEVTARQEWERVRATRNRRLAASDWSALPDVPMSDEVRRAWFDYRQALRDITEQSDPFSIVWPETPWK
jgi:hypothetical protein